MFSFSSSFTYTVGLTGPVRGVGGPAPHAMAPQSGQAAGRIYGTVIVPAIFTLLSTHVTECDLSCLNQIYLIMEYV